MHVHGLKYLSILQPCEYRQITQVADIGFALGSILEPDPDFPTISRLDFNNVQFNSHGVKSLSWVMPLLLILSDTGFGKHPSAGALAWYRFYGRAVFPHRHGRSSSFPKISIARPHSRAGCRRMTGPELRSPSVEAGPGCSRRRGCGQGEKSKTMLFLLSSRLRESVWWITVRRPVPQSPNSTHRMGPMIPLKLVWSRSSRRRRRSM